MITRIIYLLISVVMFSTVYASSWGLRRMFITDSINAVGIRRASTIITPGFIPNVLPEAVIPGIKLPTNIRFIDNDHSLYEEFSCKESFNVAPPKVTRENEHSIRVDLKKK